MEPLMDERVQVLVDQLAALVRTPLSVWCHEGTYLIDENHFTLTFTLSDDALAIHKIDTHGNTGRGREIVAVIHEQADRYAFEVIACNVLDSAQGFWEKMGYQEGAETGEFYRVS